MKFEELREQYPFFVYRSFRHWVEDAAFCMEFCFAIGDKEGKDAHVFTPRLRIPWRQFFISPAEVADRKTKFDLLVFHCGLIEAISYWKCTCSPKVRIECGHLNEAQTEWFQKLCYFGLGEFFYLNGIAAKREDFMQVSCADDALQRRFSTSEEAEFGLRERFLVPVGGGKDSVVTLEILRHALENKVRPFIINPRGATRNCCLQAGFQDEDCLVVHRNIDPHLLELNAQGYLNGHTPFSAMLAFTSLVVAALSESRHIALSNENSANESTVPGQNINHQYSKSLEFESDFRWYVEKHISAQFNYFSFLRPLSETGIAQLFASLPAYHSVFRSCNAGSKTDSWCGVCPKCLFAFLMVAPFMGIEKTSRVFGKNLLNDAALKPILDQLTGVQPVKPFECVGTLSEVNWALQQLAPHKDKHVLLQHYFAQSVSKNIVPDSVLDEFSSEHHLPENLQKLLQNAIAELRTKREKNSHLITPEIPERTQQKFKPFFENAARIAILGAGREGMSSCRFIHRLFPEKRFEFFDADPTLNVSDFGSLTAGKDFLKESFIPRLPQLDLVLKTPGISLKDHPELRSDPKMVSQTDLFLRAFSPQTIGISGTKGKSTTTHLVHHLMNPYVPCVLAGNMGIPPFDVADEITPETRIVCEFSAHQLENIATPPHIGVLLNLFEEHLDHYNSFEAYQRAKMNLAGADNRFIFHEDDPLIQARLAERSDLRNALQSGKFLTYSATHPVKNGLYCRDHRIFTSQGEEVFDLSQPHPLIGNHNVLNLMAALLAAHASGIPYAQLRNRIASFKPLPHRLQYVGCVNGKHFFNDSISTIPQAAIEAVKSVESLPFVKGVDCLILGGFDRGIDYTPLVSHLCAHPIKSLIFVGMAGKRIHSALKERNGLPEHFLCADDYAVLVPWAMEHTAEGAACVLSPAAASYDRFKNFEERGEVYMQLIKNYSQI